MWIIVRNAYKSVVSAYFVIMHTIENEKENDLTAFNLKFKQLN